MVAIEFYKIIKGNKNAEILATVINRLYVCPLYFWQFSQVMCERYRAQKHRTKLHVCTFSPIFLTQSPLRVNYKPVTTA